MRSNVPSSRAGPPYWISLIETTVRKGISAIALEWHDYHRHLPWYRRYEFLVPSLLAAVAIAVVLSPPAGEPAGFGPWLRILCSYFLLFTWAVLILSDKDKPVWLKRASSISVIALFFVYFYLYSGADWGRMGEKFFNLEKLDGVWPMYLAGVSVSIQLTLLSAGASVALGALIGVLRTFHNPVLSALAILYVDIFRSFPLIALMMVVFYALPFVGLQLSAFAAASVSIILMYSAYMSEMVRSGVESVDRTQIDAARSLGMGQVQALVYVVIPQAVRIIIPPLTSSCIGILKDTVVAYVVTLPELLTQAQQAASWKQNPTPVVISSVIYLIVLFPLTRFSSRLEKRSKRWVRIV